MAPEPYDPHMLRAAPLTSDAPGPSAQQDTSLGELLRRLTTDTGALVQQEMLLAKAELRETGATIARDGAKVGVAVGLALAGALALTAFAVIALGAALDNYWLSALIVGIVLVGIGVVLGRNALADIKQRGLVPKQTLGSLREDAAWAGHEARAVRAELTTPPRGD